MANTAAIGGGSDMRQIVARLERLPYSSWHRNMRLIICSAWFFDAFDSITIAYVLPPLIGLWHIGPQQIGSLAFGWLGERWGRINSMIVTLLIFTLGGLACAFVTNYETMYWWRFV